MGWHETTLYRTKRGAFFHSEKGEPRSMWAERHGNAITKASGLRVTDVEEARARMEAAGCPEHVFDGFGLPLLKG